MEASTTERHPLTPRQQEVLLWISGYIDTHGYSPTIREIASAFGWTTNGVMCHLRPMRRKGVVVWLDGHSRTIRVIGGDA
jgi:repressor LexA